MRARVIYRTNGHAINTVEVASVPKRGTISRSKDKDGPFPTAPIIYPVQDGPSDEEIWALHRTARIGRSPATAVYRVFLVSVVDRRRLVHVGYRR